jgi:hypothetical protein
MMDRPFPDTHWDDVPPLVEDDACTNRIGDLCMDGTIPEWAAEQLDELHRETLAAAASQARREALTEFLSAARSCARFRCEMTEDMLVCPDCGATVEGNDPVRGVCQADAIRQIRADVIETYLHRALATPQERRETGRDDDAV